MPWNPKSAKGNRISFSEASALAKCEEAWNQQYRHGVQTETAGAMLKGTLIGTGANAFWRREDWRAAMGEQWANDPEFANLASDDPVVDDATWLMDRYARWYADMLDEVEIVHTELELSARVPGTRTTVMGHLDEVWRWRDRLYMVERKTYGRRDRLEILHVDPQLGTYPWLCRENGIDLYGVLFDGIYTQRWALEKPTQKALIEEQEEFVAADVISMPAWEAHGLSKRDWAKAQVDAHPGLERHLAESFDLTPIVRTDEQMERNLELWLKPAISRRTALRRGAVPVRNLNSMSCRFCSVREKCWDELAFGRSEFQVDA